MAKYKSTAEAPKRTGRFLYFADDETKKIKVTDWTFDKNPAGYLFRAYIEEENGEEVDKIWTVWDYNFAQQLKKTLGTKASGTKELNVKMTKVDDEMKFEIIKE